ncbi:MAG: LLM class flavin-dependent oxidoreductase [Acidimicrobiales bacterium]
MRFDCNFYGGVPMPDAGKAGPAPTDRRYGNDAVVAGYENLVHWARTMDGLPYDTMWLTEHHFQYEGYEVVPNLVQFGLWLVSRTERLRLGQMFNVVPQWHPLRLAEDYAMAQILSGDRMVFGVGRGTVPREAQSLGAVVASGDNEMSREADRVNRELFEEAMEVIKAAWWNETFSYTGKHFVFPPPGIPDRGATVKDLTLIPKPIAPIEIWQAVTSPETLEYAPRVRHHGVIPAATRRWWCRRGALRRDRAGARLGDRAGRGPVPVHQLPSRLVAVGGAAQRAQRMGRVGEVPVALRSVQDVRSGRRGRGTARLRPFVGGGDRQPGDRVRIARRGGRAAGLLARDPGRRAPGAVLRHARPEPRKQLDEQLVGFADEVMPRLRRERPRVRRRRWAGDGGMGRSGRVTRTVAADGSRPLAAASRTLPRQPAAPSPPAPWRAAPPSDPARTTGFLR